MYEASKNTQAPLNFVLNLLKIILDGFQRSSTSAIRLKHQKPIRK